MTETDRFALDTISLVAAVMALYAVLRLELLSALLSGLLVAQLVYATVPVLNQLGIASNKLGKAIALILVAAIVSIAIALAIGGNVAAYHRPGKPLSSAAAYGRSHRHGARSSAVLGKAISSEQHGGIRNRGFELVSRQCLATASRGSRRRRLPHANHRRHDHRRHDRLHARHPEWGDRSACCGA